MNEKIYFTGVDTYEEIGINFEQIEELGGRVEIWRDNKEQKLGVPFSDFIVIWTFFGDILNAPNWMIKTTYEYGMLIEKYPLWYGYTRAVEDLEENKDFKELLIAYKSDEREELFRQFTR